MRLMFMKIWMMTTLLIVCGWASNAFSDQYSEQWGPVIGNRLPILEAKDHQGRLRTFEDLKGKNGLLLFMNRSADW